MTTAGFIDLCLPFEFLQMVKGVAQTNYNGISMPHSILRCSDFPIPFCLEECQRIITSFCCCCWFFLFLVCLCYGQIEPFLQVPVLVVLLGTGFYLMLTFLLPQFVCVLLMLVLRPWRTSAVSIAAPSTAASWSSGSPAYSSGGTGPVSSWLQVLGLVLLTLVEFPEVFFLSLADDGENTSDGFANSWDLGEFGSRAT